MNNLDFINRLEELNACNGAIEWVGDKDFKTAWNKCVRADWMLWIICKMEIGTRRERIHIICDCAATALKYVPKGEDRPRLAIEAARKYADKKTNANLEKLNAAGTAAWAAGTATRAVGAAARAAWDAAGAAAWAAARDTAEDAAEAAAWTATWAATEDAADKKICNMIRKKISIKEI